MCNDIKVVDMVTHDLLNAYSGYGPGHHARLGGAMCSAGKSGSVLAWADYKVVIELRWNEETKLLDEVRKARLPISQNSQSVAYMCYIPQTDLVVLMWSGMVHAVKLDGSDHSPVWQLQGELLGKVVPRPYGIRNDSEGRVYIGDHNNKRVLLVNGYTGEVMQQVGKEAGFGLVSNLCCLDNPCQLLMKHWGFHHNVILTLLKKVSL